MRGTPCFTAPFLRLSPRSSSFVASLPSPLSPTCPLHSSSLPSRRRYRPRSLCLPRQLSVRAMTPSPDSNPGIDAVVKASRFGDCFCDVAPSDAIPIDLVMPTDWDTYLSSSDEGCRTWLSSFSSPPSSPVAVPSPQQGLSFFAVPLPPATKDPNPVARVAAALSSLPSSKTYAVRARPDDLSPYVVELAWGLLRYSFSMYKKKKDEKPSSILTRLTTKDSAPRADVDSALSATYMVRDLISTTAEDLGPAELEAAVSALASLHAASCTTIATDQLKALGFPQVHTVGRAATAARGPRLLDLQWRAPGVPDDAPQLALVGKGVCYDTGGLSLKPSNAMMTMKKDMGGAAQVLGLAHMVMTSKLPIRLRVLIPAVENAVSADSYRPGDVLTARNGKTTLNVNSDAEGRLILADALAAAAEQTPDLIIDMATLTGAQRVAMGPDIPSFFCTDEELTTDLFAISKKENDLVWPMPLYQKYRAQLDTPIADLKSCASSGHGGSIHAALYLREFVADCRWIHLDMMGYNASSSPGRPEGGEAMGMRALFEMLRQRYAKQ